MLIELHIGLNATSTTLMGYMNLDEAVELLGVVSAIPKKNSEQHPDIRIFHKIGEGYTLHIKSDAVTAEYRNHLNRIAESYKLAIRESKRYLIIYGHPSGLSFSL